MRKGLVVSVLLMASFLAICQNKVTKLLEYLPAPGQHINIENIGTPQSALNMVADDDAMVSLGAFGGTIILGFEQPCENNPNSPYGVDFTIFGNAFEGASEPGIVYVMKDNNANGLADDTWYEIAGSNHYHPNTIRNYSLTYYNPNGLFDIQWKDSNGILGQVKANSYHEQEYYPKSDIFSGYPHDSITFIGTLLEPTYYKDNFGIIRLQALAFGYADNYPKKHGVPINIPDNPYTLDVQEGAGGNPIDISWAVDSLDNYVELDQIDFVKVTTSNLANLGWLGEISTDITTIVDVEPSANSGITQSMVIYHHPPEILTKDSLHIFVQYFDLGKPVVGIPIFQSSDEEIASINKDGLVTTKKGGEIEVFVYPEGKEEFQCKTTLLVLDPTEIKILSDFSSVYPGDSIELSVNILDQFGNNINGLDYSISSNDNQAFRVVQQGNKYYLVAENSGQGTLTAVLNRDSKITQTVTVVVLKPENRVSVFITIKNEVDNILPFQKVEVPIFNLNSYVENRDADYSSIQQPVLAHAIVNAMNLAGSPFRFRDDEKSGGKLYLYSVEQGDFFTYGWGGLTNPMAFAKAWIAWLNGNSYLNDFDKTTIHTGDSIILYHTSDLLNPWGLNILSISSDSVSIGELIEVELKKTSCKLQDQQIIEADFVPVVNKEVAVLDGETQINLGFTDSNGKYSFLVNISPPLTISSGNDALLVHDKFVTGTSFLQKERLKVYPNPVKDNLYLSGNITSEVELTILNLNGQIVFRKHYNSLPGNISLSLLIQGQYLLKLTSSDYSTIIKLIK